MGDDEKLARLEKKKGKLVTGELNGIPDTRKSRRINSEIADILERQRRHAETVAGTVKRIMEMPQVSDVPETAPMSASIVEEPPKEPIENIPVIEEPFDLSPELPLPDEINMIEDPYLRRYLAEFNRQLRDPNRQTVDEPLKQAILALPLSKSFHSVMEAYFIVQLHQAGKGPAYIPPKV